MFYFFLYINLNIPTRKTAAIAGFYFRGAGSVGLLLSIKSLAENENTYYKKTCVCVTYYYRR
jgi:hypothetical protein